MNEKTIFIVLEEIDEKGFEKKNVHS